MHEVTRHARTAGPLALGLLLVGALAGCGAPEFRPLSADSSTPTDLAAARYDLKVDTQEGGKRRIGDAKVWSDGPPRDGAIAPGDPDTMVEVALRLRNESDSPMRLDLGDTQLEVRTEKDKLYVVDKVLEQIGDQQVLPNKTGRIDLVFQLPANVKIGDVSGYELVWAVKTEAGDRVAQSTTFIRAKNGNGYGYVPYGYGWGGYGWGYPYGYGWGWGPGLGWGWY
jgi:hypothetical protein